MQAELILDVRNAVGESPVWNIQQQALYWADIPARRLHCWHAASGQSQSWQADEMLACIAHCADNKGWIGAMQSGIFDLQPQADGTLQSRLLASVNHSHADMRFNDGRCDRQGRFWVGSMLLDMAAGIPAGALYRFADGQLSQQLDGFIVPNGLGFSPDGRTLYLSDSHPSVQLIWAFDYDTDTATAHNRRVFVDMNLFPGRPDGAAVDADGCYWICGNDEGLIHRFTPQGKLDRSLAVPVKKPAMCAFGGADLSTLFVTSIRPGGDLSDQPLAGGVFALQPGVKGLPEPEFRG